MSGSGSFGERPLSQRPAARPQTPPMSAIHQQGAPVLGSGYMPPMQPPGPRRRRGLSVGLWVAGGVLVAIAVVVAAAGMMGGSSSAGPHYPTTKCLAAFNRASEQLEEHFRTHPSITSDAPTDAEIDEGTAIWNSIEDPLFDACTGVEDFYQAAYAQGEKGAWGLRGSAAISDQELRDIFISSYCATQTHRSSCSDYKPKG